MTADNPVGYNDQVQATIIGTEDVNVAKFGGTAVTLGQKTAAASIPVVLASDEGSIPVTQGTTPWVVAGGKTNNSAAPGATNVGALVGVANVAAPTYIEGNQVLSSLDLAGNTRVVLNPETTKVIGTVNQGTSPWVVSPSASAQSGSVNTAFGTATTQTAKASAGNLISFAVSNINAGLRFFQIFNSTGSTAGTPVISLPLLPGTAVVPGMLIIDSSFFGNGSNGLPFSTGITWGISTAAATYAAATAADHTVNLVYV